MSRAMVCDQCGAVLPLNARGEAESGEDAAWLSLTAGGSTYDLCTRVCAHALLDDDDFRASVDAYTEIITEIANVVRDERDA